MDAPAVVDARNLLDPAALRRLGFAYSGNRPPVRVVVAGGAGFLGSHLCDALVARGDEVLAIDDLSTGRTANVAHLGDNPAFELVVGDVSTGVDVSGSVGAVAHLASPASPPAYLARPLGTLAVGSEGTRHLLELAGRHGARFLLASTSEIYGDPAVHPQTEDYRGNVDPIGRAASTTRPSASPRRSPRRTGARSGPTRPSCASSTPTAPG